MYPAYVISFNFPNVGKIFWSLNPKDCIVVLCSCPRQNVKLGIVVMQWWLRNVQKSMMHVQSCCFANPTLLLFYLSCCRRRHHCLSFLIGAITPNTSSLRSHNKFLGDVTVDTSFATAASNLNTALLAVLRTVHHFTGSEIAPSWSPMRLKI